MVSIRSSTWLCMTTSLSTMAATRSNSTIWACRPVLISRPAHRPMSLRCSLKCIVFTLSVAIDAFFQKRIHSTAGNVAEAFEDNLEENATIRFIIAVGVETPFIVVDPVTIDHPEFPAAAVVLEAAECFHGPVAAIVALPAADQAPLWGNRPHEGHVMMVGLVVVADIVWRARDSVVRVGCPLACFSIETHGVVAVAIADIQDLARVVLRLVVPHGAAATSFALVGIPVE